MDTDTRDERGKEGTRELFDSSWPYGEERTIETQEKIDKTTEMVSKKVTGAKKRKCGFVGKRPAKAAFHCSGKCMCRDSLFDHSYCGGYLSMSSELQLC